MQELGSYVRTWEERYQSTLGNIPLLDPAQAHHLSASQRGYFAQLFWHVRGHFADFLWILGSKAPDRKSKLIVLDNIADEFGARDENHTAHEVFYNKFAATLGVDTSHYAAGEALYLPFLKEYNQSHLRFLISENWEVCSAAFSAYERLDNFDYGAVEEVGKCWGLDRQALQFFEVHRQSNHFGEVSADLARIWERDANLVKKGFTFIGNTQLEMWSNLSEAVCGYDL